MGAQGIVEEFAADGMGLRMGESSGEAVQGVFAALRVTAESEQVRLCVCVVPPLHAVEETW